MKILILLFTIITILTTTASAQVVNIHEPDRVYAEIPSRYNGWAGYHTRTWAHYDEGWRDADAWPTCPAGYTVQNVTWELVDDVAVVSWDCEPIPEPAPEPDTLVPILDGEGNPIGTARVLATEELGLIAVINSESPQRPIAEQIAEYRAKREALQAKRAEAADVAGQAAAANSVPALRAEVQRLALIVEELIGGE